MQDPQKTPHNSPWRASYGMSYVNICEKIDRVKMALHCIKTIFPGIGIPIIKIYGLIAI